MRSMRIPLLALLTSLALVLASCGKQEEAKVEKAVDQPQLTLATGESFTVNYTVRTGATYSDASWAVHGTISVNNPAPIAAQLAAVTDVISGPETAAVTCPGLIVPAKCSESCNAPSTSRARVAGRIPAPARAARAARWR